MFKGVSEIYPVAKDIFFKRYPNFVYSDVIGENEVPCFNFHGVDTKSFEKKLQYLQNNNYHTLSIHEFYNVLTQKCRKPHERSILLTFDDGTGSMWSVAYPLLKKYNMRGTVFLVPSRIKHRTKYLPNLDDVWAGRASQKTIDSRDDSDEPFATWEEIQEMNESGCMDFESHSLDHSLIFISSRIIDFVHPKILEQYHRFEFPRIREGANSITDIIELGMPLYKTAPRLSQSFRYIDDIALRETCMNYVNQEGGKIFFKRSNWRRELRKVVKNHHNSNHGYESKKQRLEAIMLELLRSKELIDEHLSGSHTQHLCYPWGVGSAFTMNIAQKIGYKTGFWDPVGGSKKIVIGQNPHQIPRIGPDFFYMLPGEGRINLSQVLLKKILRRFHQSTSYLTH